MNKSDVRIATKWLQRTLCVKCLPIKIKANSTSYGVRSEHTAKNNVLYCLHAIASSMSLEECLIHLSVWVSWSSSLFDWNKWLLNLRETGFVFQNFSLNIQDLQELREFSMFVWIETICLILNQSKKRILQWIHYAKILAFTKQWESLSRK